MSVLPASYIPRELEPVSLAGTLKDIADRNAGHPVVVFYAHPKPCHVRGALDVVAEVEAGIEATQVIPIDLDRLPAQSLLTRNGDQRQPDDILAILHDANLI